VSTGTEHNKRTIRRVFDEFVNQGDFSIVDDIYRADIIDHEGLPGAPEGREGVKYTIAGLRHAFPDLQVTIEDMSADGDMVVIHNTWRGTHLGDLLGVAPTGRTIESKGIVIWRFQDGLIAERWAHGVATNMFEQLGMRMLAPRRGSRGARSAGGETVVRLLPIRNGKPSAWAGLREQLEGPRRREYEESRRRLGISREVFRLDPRGDRDHVVYYYEVADPARAAKRWAESDHEFDIWLREQVLDIHGADPWGAVSADSATGLTWSAPAQAVVASTPAVFAA
jgi:predicted ester cyclase